MRAVQSLASDILTRIEQLLKDNPAIVADKKSTMFPREIEDGRTYFLQKLQHVRGTLVELDALFQMTCETCDPRELIRAELMLLFVLIEGYRPERLLESGWNPDQHAPQEIRQQVESLGLDLINMRERLK